MVKNDIEGHGGLISPYTLIAFCFFLFLLVFTSPSYANDQVLDYGQATGPYCGFEDGDFIYICVKVFGKETHMLMEFEADYSALEKLKEGTPVQVKYRTVMVPVEPGSDQLEPNPIAEEFRVVAQ